MREDPRKMRFVPGADPRAIKLGILEVVSAAERDEIYHLALGYWVRNDILQRCQINRRRGINNQHRAFPDTRADVSRGQSRKETEIPE